MTTIRCHGNPSSMIQGSEVIGPASLGNSWKALRSMETIIRGIGTTREYDRSTITTGSNRRIPELRSQRSHPVAAFELAALLLFFGYVAVMTGGLRSHAPREVRTRPYRISVLVTAGAAL